MALSDTEEAVMDDEEEEPVSGDKEMNKLRARRNTLQIDLIGIKKASVSNELKKEQEKHIKRQLEECAYKMRLAMPPHLKVAAAHRRVAQSAKIVGKALEANLQAKKKQPYEAAEQNDNTAE